MKFSPSETNTCVGVGRVYVTCACTVWMFFINSFGAIDQPSWKQDRQEDFEAWFSLATQGTSTSIRNSWQMKASIIQAQEDNASISTSTRKRKIWFLRLSLCLVLCLHQTCFTENKCSCACVCAYCMSLVKTDVIRDKTKQTNLPYHLT